VGLGRRGRGRGRSSSLGLPDLAESGTDAMGSELVGSELVGSELVGSELVKCGCCGCPSSLEPIPRLRCCCALVRSRPKATSLLVHSLLPHSLLRAHHYAPLRRHRN